MVLNVTGARIGQPFALKLVEQLLGVLAKCIDQNVQAATVGHTQNNFLGAIMACPLDKLVHAGNKAFAALKPETLDAGVTRAKIFFQTLGRREALQNVFTRFSPITRLGANWLHTLLKPALNAGINYVHVLGANTAAVRLLQSVDYVSELHGFRAKAQRTGLEGQIPVSFR